MGNQVLNNTIYNYGQTGLVLPNSKNGVFKNNIFMGAAQSQVQVEAQSVTNTGNVFANNDYFKSGTSLIGVWNTTSTYPAANLTLSGWNSNSGETGDISADRLFVSASTGDFHLQSSSLAKDAGTTVATVTTDYEGTRACLQSIATAPWPR